MKAGKPRILIIRRDNIGDLVCTTPLITALRTRYPEAFIGVYANSYNAPVIAHHEQIDHVYTYTKAKHRSGGDRLFRTYLDRLKTLRALRRIGFDHVIVAEPGSGRRALKLARWLGAKQIVRFCGSGEPARRIERCIAPHPELHEVEDIFRLGEPLGIGGPPPAACVALRDSSRQAMDARLEAAGVSVDTPLIGVHISARKPSQRWPMERYAALIAALHTRYKAKILLLWSPGSNADPHHPGDDDNAADLMKRVDAGAVVAVATTELEMLIAALDACNGVFCSDGGAMHIASALQKPIVCLFGKSNAQRWRPWGVPHRVLQDQATLDAASISVEMAMQACDALWSDYIAK